MCVPICELGQPGLFHNRSCPAQFYMFGLIWTLFFWHGVVHTSTSTCSPDRFFVCFPPEKCDRFNDPGEKKRQQNSETKKPTKKAGTHQFRACLTNTVLKFQIEIRKIERGVTIFSRYYLVNVRELFFGLTLDGWRTEQCGLIEIFLRFHNFVYTPFSPWSGTTSFWTHNMEFIVKMSAKK